MYDTILVPTDGSKGAAVANEHAVRLAREHGATVHALYVLDRRRLPTVGANPAGAVSSGFDVAGLEEEFEQEGEEAVAELAEAAEAAGVDCETAVAEGIPNEVIVDYADEDGVDLVTIATHGRTGVDRLLLGSVTEKVVRQSNVPVLTVRSSEAE